MLSNIALGNNYYSTDPNKLLHIYLNNARIYYSTFKAEVDLKCLGSEIFIEEWVDKMDYSFTSPPYFDLEIYSDDETQSVNNKSNLEGYEKWLKDFVKPTIDNIHKYLKKEGLAIINIKNIPKYPLYDDWYRLFKEHGGFEEYDEIILNWDRVKNTVNNMPDSYNEKMMVFKKI